MRVIKRLKSADSGYESLQKGPEVLCCDSCIGLDLILGVGKIVEEIAVVCHNGICQNFHPGVAGSDDFRNG